MIFKAVAAISKQQAFAGRSSAFLSTVAKPTSEFARHTKLFKSLDIEWENHGVYNGAWSGTGPVVFCIFNSGNYFVFSGSYSILQSSNKKYLVTQYSNYMKQIY